jgi:hypothetical protein
MLETPAQLWFVRIAPALPISPAILKYSPEILNQVDVYTI